MPSADFDTVIGEDFAEAASSELVTVSGTTSVAALNSTVRAGVFELTAADGGSDGSGALQLKGAGAHIQLQNAAAGGPWYFAGLAKIIQPGDLTNTIADLIAVSDDGNGQNFLSIGIYGPGSGGSLTHWIASCFASGSAVFQQAGPLLDPPEGEVYHRAAMWVDDATPAKIHFSLDGVEFGTPQLASAAAATFGKLKCRAVATAGNAVAVDFDKWCVVCKSMTVGES